MKRVKFQACDSDPSFLSLLIPKEMLSAIGFNESTEVYAVYYDREIRICKPKRRCDMESS